MNQKERFKYFRMSAGKRRMIKQVWGLCEGCKQKYWATLLEDGAVLTIHGDEQGMPKGDQCFDELYKISEKLRKEMTS